MLRIDNIQKINKKYVGRRYRVEVVIGTPYVYFFQLRNISNSNILIAQLNRIATAKGKYGLELNNKSDYLTIKELKTPHIVRDKIKGLMKC
jgi:hypothetical protein